MYKERILPVFNGKGLVDRLYSSTSSVSSQINMPATDIAIKLAQEAEYKQHFAARQTTLYGVQYEGTQRFFSTEHKRPAYNNCINRKSVSLNIPYNSWTSKYNAYSPYGTFYKSYFYRLPVPNIIEPILSDLDNAVFDGARRRAWWSMQPRFEGDVSMLNFLFELKDFKDIMKFIARINFAEILDELTHGIRDLNRSKRSWDPTAAVASLHLANEFALKPLISDCLAILSQLVQCARDAQTQFENSSFLTQKSHYSESVVINNQLTPGTYNNWYIETGESEKAVFTATLEYHFKYTMRSQFDTFLKYWGLSGSFEAYWNAVPFSFLVDYFVKIGKSIHAMEIDKNVNLIPHQYCESILHTKEAGYFLAPARTGNVYWNHATYVVDGIWSRPSVERQLVSGRNVSNYTRRPTVPNKGVALPRVAVPSWAQQKNMLALLRCAL